MSLSSSSNNPTSTSAPGAASPTSSMPTSPTPAPMPMPGPNAAPDSYLATFICCNFSKNESAEGQITLDMAANNGAGNVTITNAGGNVGANQPMILQFCPFPQNDTNCINVTSFTTDSSGKANMNFMFPQKGTFAGAFQILNNGTQFLVTASGSTSAVNFQSALLPAGSITGGINQVTGSAPGSGAATVTGTTAHLSLSGTFSNHTFQAAVCGINGSCTMLSSVATDMQGNASADIAMLPPFDSVLFVVSDSSGTQFISAFRVQ